MTFAASIALLSAGIACYVAVLSRQLSRAPGWHDQRFFSLAALSVTGYAILNVPTSAHILSDGAVIICTRIQFALAALHTYAWLRYASILVGRPGSRTDRLLVPVLVILAALGAVPGAFTTDLVRTHTFEPLAITYRSPETTAAGDAAYALVLGLLAFPIARFGRAWRSGVPNAGVQFIALAVLMLMGVNDLLVLMGAYSAPYLVDAAFLIPIAAVGYVLTWRFVENARAHDALRHDLEREVAERTADLGRTQEALHKAEKLAALGQFAAGVAHEVNNPAAVINANLQYLANSERGSLSEDGVDALEESKVAMQRIAAIVRQLLDAGRLAASPETRTSIPVRPLVDDAFSVARARFGKRVRLTNFVAPETHVLAGEGVLAQVLVNLVVNAVQAIPDHRSDGHVAARAPQEGDRVRIVVEDNGAGMEPDVLRRVFEPFFTTKPFGSGSGLGLAVSRGLVTSLGGDLRLESELGQGTHAIIELAAATPPAAPLDRTGARGGFEPPLRMLIVDDEAPVLTSLRRLLEPRYRIELASGVDEGLALAESGRFDVLLCDVMMPAGGGERLYRTLLRRAPSLARRVVFLTGGAVTDAARQFLHEQPQPILDKPLEVEDLARVTARVREAGDARLARS
jgi:signal transduction histidine kinase/ActR/RegA family two-component response regulator